MPLQTRVVKSGLLRKGFEEQEGKHKTLRYITTDGTPTSVVTHLSHGSSGKEIQDWVISKMAGQCRVSTRQFKQLVDCTLSSEDYEALLPVEATKAT